jgi:predicted ArsR family transcriptional regulator
VSAPPLGARRLALLGALKRLGPAGVPGLAADQGLTVETVREHLAALERQRLVERTAAPRTGARGRPELRYRLTREAEAHFPRREGETLAAFAEWLRDTGQEAVLARFFAQRFVPGREAALARVAPLTGRARVAETARILTEHGFLAEAEASGRGAVLRLRHCPLRELVDVTTVPCRAEGRFVAALLGGRPRRTTWLPAGDACCTYRIGDEDDTGSLASRPRRGRAPAPDARGPRTAPGAGGPPRRRRGPDAG